MPSTRKQMMFLLGSLGSLAALLIVSSSLATQDWIASEIDCKNNSDPGTGKLEMSFGLFTGNGERSSCPYFADKFSISVLKVVNKGTTSGPLHALVVTFLAVSLFCSLCSFGTSAYNIFSNPYETYLGPIGVYVWSSISDQKKKNNIHTLLPDPKMAAQMSLPASSDDNASGSIQ
ncbi:clarin-3 [Polypterus senegalus]|uniref:clarin-3 n=1 Tax=Polypterus senegalus TaxID=55291 RepID=UPI001963E324|nr:clarin-3 [Polypterus senegalus]